MDNAVALVESYLRVNGYLTVTEYPLVEVRAYGEHRTATDLDILAFRFPGAGRLVSRRGGTATTDFGLVNYAPDPVLGCDPQLADMLIGEVKEGRAELNAATREPAVLEAALSRFGCCGPVPVQKVVEVLLRQGRAQTHSGHIIRRVVFGSTAGQQGGHGVKIVSLGHVRKFLQDFVREHWDVLRHEQLKDPALGFLVMLEKAGGAMT